MSEKIREKDSFLSAAKAWVCDGYSCDIRFISSAVPADYSLWEAAVYLNPIPPPEDLTTIIECEGVVVGNLQLIRRKKRELFGIIEEALDGRIFIPKRMLRLPSNGSLHLYSDRSNRDRWFYDLHMYVGGDVRPNQPQVEFSAIDSALRAASPPFDGLGDISNWLGISNPTDGSRSSGINIRVSPPADLLVDACSLHEEKLRIVINAHPKFDIKHIGLAVRAVPEYGLSSRRQIADKLVWGKAIDGIRTGVAEVEFKGSDSAVVMLLIGSVTVRRQWFVDASKARNHRLLAVQSFDKDLKMIRQAVLEHADAAKFESGIAALLFLLGFSPSVQIETDSPDLVVATPYGRIALVECTTRVADLSSKIGKLVDRRGALTKSLQDSKHPANVAAVLVCRLPRDQIPAQIEHLRAHRVILLTKEDLEAGFDRLRVPNDPDRMLADAEAALVEKAKFLFGS